MANPMTLGDLNYEVAAAHLIKFDPSDALPDYIGLHTDKDAADTDTGWVIYKFTYTDSAATVIKKTRGAWGSRASLF